MGRRKPWAKAEGEAEGVRFGGVVVPPTRTGMQHQYEYSAVQIILIKVKNWARAQTRRSHARSLRKESRRAPTIFRRFHPPCWGPRPAPPSPAVATPCRAHASVVSHATMVNRSPRGQVARKRTAASAGTGSPPPPQHTPRPFQSPGSPCRPPRSAQQRAPRVRPLIGQRHPPSG